MTRRIDSTTANRERENFYLLVRNNMTDGTLADRLSRIADDELTGRHSFARVEREVLVREAARRLRADSDA